jgi:hypothetical protein
MHWVVQENLHREEGYESLKAAIRRYNLPHTEVKVVPFSHELIPVPKIDDKHVIVMGSYSLCVAANKLGWKPGAFLNHNFTYYTCFLYYGEHMLNGDGYICPLGEVPKHAEWPEFFMRPNDDSKAFAGDIIHIDDCKEWIEKIRDIETKSYTTLDLKTEVLIAPLKKIQKEFRFFVVGGKVVTGSQYKIGTRVHYDPVVDVEAAAYAQRMASVWQPADAFVLDVAYVNGEYKIIEINCMNAAGYYACDVSKIIQAVEALYA